MTQRDLVPDATFLRSTGESVQLSDLITGPTLLIFLRHLA